MDKNSPNKNVLRNQSGPGGNRGKVNNNPPPTGNSAGGIKRRSDNGGGRPPFGLGGSGGPMRGGPMGHPGNFGSPIMPPGMPPGMDPAWMDQPRPPPMGIMGAPTYELPVREKSEEERKFTGRCRIFVANLPPKSSEPMLKELFEQFGEVSEVFLGKGNAFAFVKMDTRKHAEDARDALDNKNYEGRTLRVRLAAHAAAVKVKNLSPMVTNELLEYAFCYFGEVERAIVITDERGRSIGEGIVEFARKSSAQLCLKRCTTECFLLTANPSPVIVEPFEQRDEDEGFTERHVMRHTHEFRMEREIGPRFAEPGTFEYEFGNRWKQLYDLEKEKRERLEVEVREARQALIEQMDFARMEHQTSMLKEKLRMMEEQSGKFSELRSTRAEIEKRREEERAREEALFRQREEEILRRAVAADYGSLQHQETDLRLQANALQDLLERQESALRGMGGGGGRGAGGSAGGGVGDPSASFADDGTAGYGFASDLGPPLGDSPMEIGQRYGPGHPRMGGGLPMGDPGALPFEDLRGGPQMRAFGGFPRQSTFGGGGNKVRRRF